MGLKYEDLNSSERDTLTRWMGDLSRKTLTIEGLKQHLAQLITGLERELTEPTEPKHFFSWLFLRKRDVYLKARLRNYLMLQDFLTGPDRAKRWIEEQLHNIKKG